MAGLIDQYLPFATTGRRTAKPVPGAPVFGPVVVASAIPLPRQRPTLDANAAPMVVAANDNSDDTTDMDEDDADTTAAVAAPTDAAPTAVAAVATEAGAPASPPVAPTSVASLIGANSIFALDGADAEGDTAAGDETTDVAPPASVHSGWRIQVAASPTKDGAEDMLDAALAKGAAVLAKAEPYTEPVQTGDSTLYRARFAGFSSKEKARAACAYLAKQKFSCLAVSD
jgi:hypothetical protein